MRCFPRFLRFCQHFPDAIAGSIKGIYEVINVEWVCTLYPGKFAEERELSVPRFQIVPGIISQESPNILP
jgi:hypothetical protein